MRSKIMQKDHKALVELNKAMSPEERLMAFYQHSRLLGELASAAKKKRSPRRSRSSRPHSSNEDQ